MSGGGRGWVGDGESSKERERFPLARPVSFNGPWGSSSFWREKQRGSWRGCPRRLVVVADGGVVLSLRVDRQGGKLVNEVHHRAEKLAEERGSRGSHQRWYCSQPARKSWNAAGSLWLQWLGWVWKHRGASALPLWPLVAALGRRSGGEVRLMAMAAEENHRCAWHERTKGKVCWSECKGGSMDGCLSTWAHVRDG
jgi:hypothetical protein